MLFLAPNVIDNVILSPQCDNNLDLLFSSVVCSVLNTFLIPETRIDSHCKYIFKNLVRSYVVFLANIKICMVFNLEHY